MKKIFFLSLIIALVSIGASYAQSDRAALVIKDLKCVIPTELSGCDVAIESIDMIDVSTSGGTTKLVCHFIVPDGCEALDVDKTMIVRGFDCPIIKKCGAGYIVTITQDSQIVVTPSGNIVAVCKDKKNAVCP